MSQRTPTSFVGSDRRRRFTKRGTVIVLSVLVAGGSLGWIRANESLYYRISKALETYTEVFRRVSLEYVDDVEPEKFVRIGLDAMLASLDPYTVYMDETQS